MFLKWSGFRPEAKSSQLEMDKTMLLPHEHRHPNHSFVFKPGFGPYPVHDPDPSFKKCLHHFGPSEYTVWAVTTAVPSYLGYRVTGSIRNPNFLFGLVAGASSGLVYAYVRSYSRLCGFMPFEASLFPADLPAEKQE